MATAVFSKKRDLFTGTLDLELRENLLNCHIWSIAFYGAETGTVRAADRKQLGVLKCSAGEGWKRLVGPTMCEM